MNKMNQNMALPLFCILVFASSFVSVLSEEHFHDWTVSFSTRSILGVRKQVIVINDQFPGPTLNGSVNDMFNVNIYNNLDEPFLMTWNGVQLRGNSWEDGVEGTNCPIMPGTNWTYTFQVKDQIGSYFYFPSLLFQKAAGGFGAIKIDNAPKVPTPFPRPDFDLNVFIGDWYTTGHKEMRERLDNTGALSLPDGVLINGQGPEQEIFDFQPGATYLLRISNVGLRMTLNFKIQGHTMKLVETEGTYTVEQEYDHLDIHVGQSYSVLVKALNRTDGVSFYMSATPRFSPLQASGLAIVRYNGFHGLPAEPVSPLPMPFDVLSSLQQARNMRMNLTVGSARPNPQGSFHYGSIKINRTLVLEGTNGIVNGQTRYSINGVSFMHPDTPLKLADHFNISGVFTPGSVPDRPDWNSVPVPRLNTSVIVANFHDFVHIVFQNPLTSLQTWHLDGYNFFVVGMGNGLWSETKNNTYNLVDAVYRSTVQVYPLSWTAIYVALDNQGMWNLRSQVADQWYLGQELYLKVKGTLDDPSKISPRDESPIPSNAIRCGGALLH